MYDAYSPHMSMNQQVNITGLSGTPPRGPASVRRDMADMWHFARKAGFARELRGLQQPRLARALAAAAVDWALIALAVWATWRFGWIAVPLSLLLIGNRQRALGNL